MVKLLGYHSLALIILSLFTFVFYSQDILFSSCKIRLLSSSSFYNSVGIQIKEDFLKKHNCHLDFQVLNGAKLILNLYRQQKDQYDILIGLDIYQLKNLKEEEASLVFEEDQKQDLKIKEENIYKNIALVYDSAPISFFVKLKDKDVIFDDRNDELVSSPLSEIGSEINFYDFKDFFNFVKMNNLKIAVPLPTTSVLGGLFLNWVHLQDRNFENQMSKLNFKFVKSWSEAFGLFEKGIVTGFLSFETSSIYYKSQKNVKKISLQVGHPVLKEYFLFSKNHNLDIKTKELFLDFIFSEDVQKLLLEKNYMWPVGLEKFRYSAFKTLKELELSQIYSQKKISHLWKEKYENR